MRNNQDRLGLGTSDANIQPSQEPPPVPASALEFIVPTEIVDLPSKGVFYPEGHPLHGRETVEIKHMTTKEEDILTNQSFLKDGSAIDRLLQSVLVSPKMKVKDMLIGDKNALTVACRIHGYGEAYETGFKCPSCGTTQEYTFNLEEIEVVDYEENAEEYDVRLNYDKGTVTLPIPRTNTQLELKILVDDDSNAFAKKKSRKNRFVLSDYYTKIIHAVNGNSDRKYIKSYIDSMSALDSRYLRAAYSKVIPGVDFTAHFECNSCDYEADSEVPLNAEFFWPKS